MPSMSSCVSSGSMPMAACSVTQTSRQADSSRAKTASGTTMSDVNMIDATWGWSFEPEFQGSERISTLKHFSTTLLPWSVRSQSTRYMRLHASPVSTTMPNSSSWANTETIFMAVPPNVKGTGTQTEGACQPSKTLLQDADVR